MSDKKFYKERKMFKYISAEATYENLPPDVIKHLISLHAVKGCNTASFISGHTKKTARKVFLENRGFLANVGVRMIADNVLSSVEQFICRLYGVTQTTSVDAARHIFFQERKARNLPPTSHMIHCHST